MNQMNTTAQTLGSNKNNKPIYTAYFPALVDVVEDQGNPAFLVNDDGIPKLLPQVELCGKLYIPPPIEQFPWLLPRAEEVMNYH